MSPFALCCPRPQHLLFSILSPLPWKRHPLSLRELPLSRPYARGPVVQGGAITVPREADGGLLKLVRRGQFNNDNVHTVRGQE